MTFFTKQKQSHRLREQIEDCQQGRIGRSDSWGVWDGHVHDTVFEMDNQQGPPV